MTIDKAGEVSKLLNKIYEAEGSLRAINDKENANFYVGCSTILNSHLRVCGLGSEEIQLIKDYYLEKIRDLKRKLEEI